MSTPVASKFKFGRNYVLTITGPSIVTPIIITLPFTMEFDVKRDNYASVNNARITIYNLSKHHRNLIIHDQFDQSPDSPQILFITLRAGYGDSGEYPLIFKGNAQRAYSYRQGTEFLTIIDAQDGGTAFTNAYSTHTFQANASNPLPVSQVLSTLINDLAAYGVSEGAISTALGNFTKSQTFSGNTTALLTELSNGNFFVDNLTANVLLPTDAIGGRDVVINAASGLLGTPVKESSWILVEMLFEPRLTCGSVVQLDSSTAPDIFNNAGIGNYNGPHKVVGIHHKGVISAAVSGTATTSLELQAGVFSQVLSQAGI